MESPLGRALRLARREPDFLDLINTNFHACGLMPERGVLEAALERFLVDPTLRRYAPDPAGLPALREAIVGYYASGGLELTPASVVVTSSASESYRHLFTALSGSRREVLLPQPGYPLFEEVAVRCGLTPRFYGMRLQDAWAINPTALAGAVTDRTAALVLISPNNPTGTVADEETIRRICERCAQTQTLLIVDEVFSEYRFLPGAVAAPDRSPLVRPATLCPEALVATINGASKLLVSPDLKVSWIAMSGPASARAEAVDLLEVENDLYLNASPITQFAAARMLEAGVGVNSDTGRVVATVAERRALFLRLLREVVSRRQGLLEWVEPLGGIHLPLLVRDPAGRDDEALATGLLEEERLAAHPGFLYGVEHETLLIVSYLAPPPVLREGVERLERFLTRPRRSASAPR